jgi:hypothetical protein
LDGEAAVGAVERGVRDRVNTSDILNELITILPDRKGRSILDVLQHQVK